MFPDGKQVSGRNREIKKKILLAINEEQISAILEVFLARAGFRSASARDGGTVLANLVMDRPDLVVLDGMLSREGGPDILRSVRAKSDVPVLMLLAPEAGVAPEEAIELGADDYINKPFGGREFISHVEAVLHHRSPGKEDGTETLGGEVAGIERNNR